MNVNCLDQERRRRIENIQHVAVVSCSLNCSGIKYAVHVDAKIHFIIIH